MAVILKFFHVIGPLHPIVGQVYYRQAEATGKDAERYQLYACSILNAIAQTPGDCSRLLSNIETVERWERTEIETGGNDVSFTIRRSGIQVDIDINDDWVGQSDGQFELSEWHEILTAWKNFLKLPESESSTIELRLGAR